MGEDYTIPHLSRRKLLTLGVGGLICASPISALAARVSTGERKLSFCQMHTGETLSTVYWSEGKYIREALNDINKVLRDHRSDEITAIDPRLLDLLFTIREKAGTTRAIEVYSAYRSPKTNAMLRRRSRRVARNSYHTRGKAADIRVPGVSKRDLVVLARGLGSGGVGYYPRGVFVHVDTGPVRYWRG